jgi:hypothetical protein
MKITILETLISELVMNISLFVVEFSGLEVEFSFCPVLILFYE